MRKIAFVVCLLLVFATAAMAQKIDTKWHCTKPAENPVLKVGDTPDHNYALAQGSCSASSSTSGEKSGAWTEFDEVWKSSTAVHGRFNVTMDNGDMVYYSYEMSNAPDAKKLANKWKIASGSGKQKGIKGSGTCSGVRNDDGSSDWECTGTTSTGGAMASKN
jgi:hypothetical protein